VDVGFGPQSAPRPLKLKEDRITTAVAPAEMRLLKDSIPDLTDQDQKVWIYQTRYNPDNKWISAFCFSEVEFSPRDFDMMNFYVSKNSASWFTQKFVCTLMILDEAKETIIGEYILSNNEVKRRVQGQSEVLVKLETEKDRVAALAQWFDMHLLDEEIQGIQGMVSQIS
jgi:arylamine N-acetyltransferase